VLLLSTGARALRADTLSSPADLDGLYVVLGPLGHAMRMEGAWDGAFGGELALVHVRQSRTPSALGVALGAESYSAREGGRLWADLLAGTRTPLGGAVGLSAGFGAEVHDVVPPRFGIQATLWVFAGVVPFVRVGRFEKTGTFVDVGLKIALPALRF
jgi:hypothetical protein